MLGDALPAPADPVTLEPLAAAILQGMPDEEDDAEQAKKEEEIVKLYFRRIATAKKFKQKWEEDYEVERSHDYVRGFQRAEDDEYDAQGDKKYQINKILASLKTRIPALFYYFPYARVKPSYGREDSIGSQVSDRATLLQDTVNTIIRQPKTRFKPETMLALKEAHWAFGVIEVGYDADWGENPYQSRPKLIENEDVRRDLEGIQEIPEEDSYEEELAKLEEVPHSETFYLKHVPARQFLVATNDRSSTERQDWVAYWEWMYVEDVKRCDSFSNTKDIKANAKMANEGGEIDKDLVPTIKDDKAKDVPPDMVRIWKIWDLRDKKRYVLAEGHDRILKVTDFHYLPLAILRFEVMPGEWYPIPPIYSQLTEQDEFNDSREWLRLVRKGTRPRYVYDKQAFSADELEKFETDEFFTMVGVDNNNLDPIRPVQMPQIPDSVMRTLTLSDSGLSEQSASSPVDRLTRGAGGKPTATEVNAMGQKGEVRDSYEQQEVADWLATICTSLIKCALEKMTLPQWVIVNSDPTAQSYPMESQIIGQQFSQYMKLLNANLQAFGASEQGTEAAPMAPLPDTLQIPAAPPDMPGMAPLGSAVSTQGVNLGTPLTPPKPLGGGMAAQQFQQVTPEQLQAADDGMQWDITVDVESLSPVTEEVHGNRLLQALNLIASPGVGQLLSMSPPLLKTVLNLMGIRNAADQNNIFQALQLKMQMEQQMAMMGGPGPVGAAPMPGDASPQPGAGSPEGPQSTKGGPQPGPPKG